LAVLGSATDPDGRLVELTAERWEHISDPIDGHPELESHVEDILHAVERPDARAPGREPNEEWFFLRGAGPTRWLQVVVAYEEERGWIVTAFGRRRNP
jgi:hypothetical protein